MATSLHSVHGNPQGSLNLALIVLTQTVLRGQKHPSLTEERETRASVFYACIVLIVLLR